VTPFIRSGLFTLLLVCLSAAPALTGDAQYVFEADPTEEGAALLSGETWIGMGHGFTLRLQRIDAEQRLAFIKARTGVATDPFASPPGQPDRFVGFVMQLENNGGNTLNFRSQQAWMITDKNEHNNPIGIDTLRSSYSVMGGEMSSAYERVTQAFIPSGLSLAGGESTAGVLMYRRFKSKTKRFKIEIQLTTADGEVSTVTATYRRRKLKPGEQLPEEATQ